MQRGGSKQKEHLRNDTNQFSSLVIFDAWLPVGDGGGHDICIGQELEVKS